MKSREEQQEQQQQRMNLRKQCSVGLQSSHFVLLSKQWGEATVQLFQGQRNKRKAAQAFEGAPLNGEALLLPSVWHLALCNVTSEGSLVGPACMVGHHSAYLESAASVFKLSQTYSLSCTICPSPVMHAAKCMRDAVHTSYLQAALMCHQSNLVIHPHFRSWCFVGFHKQVGVAEPTQPHPPAKADLLVPDRQSFPFQTAVPSAVPNVPLPKAGPLVLDWQGTPKQAAAPPQSPAGVPAAVPTLSQGSHQPAVSHDSSPAIDLSSPQAKPRSIAPIVVDLTEEVWVVSLAPLSIDSVPLWVK